MPLKSQVYTQAYCYTCGCCKTQSPSYGSGMKGLKVWMRLHFKRNPKCKEHHYKYGIDKTLTTFQRDIGGNLTIEHSGRQGRAATIHKKSCGHNKALHKENLLVERLSKDYQREAEHNLNYKLQIHQDELYNKKYDIKLEKDIAPVCKRIKNKKKKKKKKKKKNKA